MIKSNSRNVQELMLLYQLAEDLAVEEVFDDGILLMLLQMAKSYVDFAKDHDISHIEVASYLPIKVNADLDSDDSINVAFIEKPIIKTIKRS